MPEEIDLSPAEEAALERAWARVGPLIAPRPDAPFAADAPDLSGLGDLLNLSRQEVLDALFDAALDSFDLALPDASFEGPADFVLETRPEGSASFGAPDQPRVPAGQAGGGEWTSGGGGAGAGGDRVARRAAGDARRARAAARQEAAEARYREKAAEVRAKVDPAHVAVVLDAVTQLLPKHFRRGRFGGADSDSVPEGALLGELDRRGLLDAKRVYPAKVHQLLARMVFLGDLVRVEEGTGDVLSSRKHVSYALPRKADAPFYSPDQPRDELGRWTEGYGTAERPGFTPAQHRERRQAASDAVRAFAAGQGSPTAAEAEAVAGHLARLTVAQIHALKAEHGLKGSAPNKAALVAKLAEKFRAHRAGRAPKEAVPDWPADYDVFGKRDVFADEPVDAGTLGPVPGKGPAAPRSAQEIASAVMHDQVRIYAAIGLSPGDVNSGDCMTAAREAVKDIRAVGGTAFYAVPRVGPAHVWVLSGGKHYDVQHPDGVSSPADLTFFQDNPDLLEQGWKASHEDPLARPADEPRDAGTPEPVAPAADVAPARAAVARGTLATPAEATAFAGALRDAVTSVAKKGSIASWCDDVALAVKHLFPSAENWQGEYVGPKGPEPHTVAKVGPYWIDVTADQFGGKRVQALTALDPAVYRGFARAPWPGSGKLDPAEDPRAARLAAALALATTQAAPPPPAPPQAPAAPASLLSGPALHAAVEARVRELVPEHLGLGTTDPTDALVPIWRVRRSVPAASRQQFDDAVRRLWRDGKVRLVARSTRDLPTSKTTADQWEDAIEGANETFFYVQPTAKLGAHA